jgi:dephospho-CoA kinase
VDREKLARVVFSNDHKLRKLERILHPLVKEKVVDEIKNFRGKMIVLDVPLLIEARWGGLVDVVIVVRATIKKEVLRLRKRSGLSRAEVLKRLKYQLPFREKRRFADFIVDNRGNLGDTDKQVKKIFDTLTKKTH